MRKVASKIQQGIKRAKRIRTRLKGQDNGRPRLTVHRTGGHIYAQLIDDTQGITIAAASTLEKDMRGKSGGNKAAAEAVGKALGERAAKAGITKVAFDKGQFKYHGRVAALADAARAAGLEF